MQILLYCRAGFEKELASEITTRASQLGIYGHAKVVEKSAFILFIPQNPNDADVLARKIKVRHLIFARQMMVVGAELNDLPEKNRIEPILSAYQNLTIDLKESSELFVDYPDNEAGNQLAGFCRKFTVPLRQVLRQNGYLKPQKSASPSEKQLMLFFTSGRSCFVGYAYQKSASPHPQGIIRLKFPPEAPSRSTLKLEEAFHTFVQDESAFHDHMYAVDLGACPGGWTYQLIRRGVFVYAVDHGKIAENLLKTGLVEHCSADGFKFEPPKNIQIEWLVCDMVEQPQKISALILKWFKNGWCRRAIFNLKLPMKKRFQEVEENLNAIRQGLADDDFELSAKHLYHDREEITVYLALKSII